MASIHKEDIKAAIRKEFGSLSAFEGLQKLPRESVTDVLRGRRVARTEAAIATVLRKPLHAVFPDWYERETDSESVKTDNSAQPPPSHRLSRGAA